MNLKSAIESLLFVAGRPVSLRELAKITGKSEEEIRNAIEEIKAGSEASGIVILEQNKNFLMTTNPENSDLVKDFLNADLREKLTEASLETLAIIAYKQPVSRAEIESIRGVNSQYTIRLLAMRGLIERTHSGSDSRVSLYRTTHEFMQHLGLKNMKDLPDFAELTAKVMPPDSLEPASGGLVTKPEGPSS